MSSVSEVSPSREPQGYAGRKVAIGYVRIAAEALSGSCLAAQTAQVRAAADAEGIELVGVVADSGQSAHNLKRPGLLKILTAVEADEVNTVIVPNLSRLARDAKDLRRLFHLFQNHGVVLVSAAEAIHSSTSAGRTRCQLASIFG
jgi:DNA invertase Pin-like site-specific DNA recombinase